MSVEKKYVVELLVAGPGTKQHHRAIHPETNPGHHQSLPTSQDRVRHLLSDDRRPSLAFRASPGLPRLLGPLRLLLRPIKHHSIQESLQPPVTNGKSHPGLLTNIFSYFFFVFHGKIIYQFNTYFLLEAYVRIVSTLLRKLPLFGAALLK